MKRIALACLLLVFISKICLSQTVSYNSNIRLNQIGFYPYCQKLGIVKDGPSGPFYIALTDASDTLFTGTLSAAGNWSFSGESVRVADFSVFNIPGDYILIVPGMGRSYPFSIKQKVHVPVNKASIKAYYYQRASASLNAANAGTWARAAGHPDNQVIILPSAASAARPAGTVLSSSKGWYDAGDYNKYVVNSGISTYTLLAAYEHYPAYYDTLYLNLPESGNGMPDILNEIKWNLDWLLTMQDPADGGIYNKVTNAGFDGFVMPAAATNPRYFCAKGTAATFDFAAVMAVAYRVYKPYNPTFASQCLAAAQLAYTWGTANPNVTFNNPPAQNGYPAVTTGGYGDNSLGDEREWAANELYISTGLDSYYANGFKNGNNYGIPSWPNVNTLGLVSLLHHRKSLTPLGLADTANMKTKLFNIANPLRTTAGNSAYRVAMGSGGNGDFSWGSNSQAANQGLILLQAYNLTKDLTYFTAALSNLDYLNGRNATTYSFVTGHGDHTPMNPHHRPSGADGITNPVPGLLVGGPNTDALADCGSGYPSTTLKAIAYQDAQCSYSTNEIAINWNAPYAYLSGAIEALNPCPPANALPVEFAWINVRKQEQSVSVEWVTVFERNNLYFIVQRSADGIHFDNLARIGGSGTTHEASYYRYTDDHPSDGSNFYRIVQVDRDGSRHYSAVTEVMFEGGGVALFPNPASGTVHVEFFSEGTGTVSLEDLAGRVLISQQTEPGHHSIQWDVSGFAKGMYLFSLQTEDNKVVKRLVVR